MDKKLIIKYFLLIFGLSFLVFNLNINSVGSGDTIPARLLPFNLFSGHGLYFDQFTDFLLNEKGTIYYFQQSNGHYVSSYPLISGLISLPIYLPFFLYLKFAGLTDIIHFYNYSLMLQKLSASLIASLSAGLFFILMKKITQKNYLSILLTLVFTFCTQTFSISSQGLWQHGTANLFLIISLLFLLPALSQKNQKRNLILTLVFGTLAFWSRPTFLIFPLILLGVTFLVNKKSFPLYLSVSALGIGALLIYNFNLYHSFFGGYGNSLATFNFTNIINGFLGLWFSPARGVLFYTPFFLFSLLSIFFYRKINHLVFPLKIFFYLNFFYFLAAFFINSFWGNWWGGHSWGNRLLTDIAVPAVILLYYFLNFLKDTLLKKIIYFLIIYSFVTQLTGVFYYTNSKWDSIPTNIDSDTKRLWDLSDNPLTRSLTAGPELRGIKILQTLFKTNQLKP